MVSVTSWTAGNLVFSKSVLQAVERDAVEAYHRDEEACGYLCGPIDRPLYCNAHVSMENIANRLHRMDPVAYFRTARTFFSFNEKKFGDAITRGQQSGCPVKVLYHSHLDAGAYFSPTDAAVMSFGEPPSVEGGPIQMGPGPVWPLAFLVTSVRQGVVDDHKLFIWDNAQSNFIVSTFSIENHEE